MSRSRPRPSRPAWSRGTTTCAPPTSSTRETFPTITFQSTSIEPKGDRWAITGDLAIRGATRRVVLDAEPLGIVTAMNGRRHAGFEARTKIRRSDWGLTWNVGLEAGGWLVSDDVTIELEVAADEMEAVAEPSQAATPA